MGDIEFGGGGTYACKYESRHTGCGGKDWSAWESNCVQFDMDNYREGWTPQKACDEYKYSDTHCSGTCCIYTEYRNNRLSSGGC